MNAGLIKSRLLNASKAYLNYALSRFGIMRFTHFPVFVSVEPSALCQLRCPECPVGVWNQRKAEDGNRSKPETEVNRLQTMPLFERVLTELSPYIHTIQFFFQGEPLLNPLLPQMIREASDEGLYTVVSTNALLLTDDVAKALLSSGLSRLIVSIDGLSQQSYSSYRQGGSLEKALQGLRNAAEAKRKLHSKTHIEWQCLALKTNEHEWQEMRLLYKRLGADSFTLKTAQLYDYINGNPLMPSDIKHSRYKKDCSGGYYLPRPWWKSSVCKRLFFGCVIDASGGVFPCCFDKERRYSFGTISISSTGQSLPFSSIWHSPEADAFRRKVLTSRPFDICHNCTE